MTDEVPSPVREGDVLAKKYRVEKVLGVGGMGVVVSAMHLQLDQRVALKSLLPSVLANADVVERFGREARAAARIKSEHVARVIDVGELDTGSPYMVMEFLEGEDLARVCTRRGPLPIEETVGYVLEACDAIAEAHAAGIIHRDLKPANLFVAKRPDRTPIVKVLDFGISKATSSVAGQLTSTQALLGSPLYMSPEQMTASRTVDPRSDIWAIGVILYELLGGRTPFLGETMPELVAAVLSSAPTPLEELRPDVPAPLAAVVARCLEKTRDARFASIAALAAALAPWGPEETRRLPERISRVLGDPQVEVQSNGDVAATVAAHSAPRRGAAPVMSPSLDESAVDTPNDVVAEPAGPNLQGTIARSAWGATRHEPRAPVQAVSVRAIAAIVGGVIAIGAVLVAVRAFQAPAPSPAALVATPALEERTPPEQPPAPKLASSVALLPLAETEPAASAVPSAQTAPAVPRERPAAAAAPASRPARPGSPTAPASVSAAASAPPPQQPGPPSPAPTNKLKMDVK